MFENDEKVYNDKQKNADNMSPVLIKSINKIIQNEGYLTYSIDIRDLSTGGGNYMSQLKEVQVKGETINNNKETSLFIKQCLSSSNQNVISPEMMFMKEKFIYTDFMELFIELQKEFNLPDEEKYEFVKYYHSNGADELTLIFDNMSRKGFKTYDRFDILPLKVMELSIKQLAKFHAFSLVLKQYKPEFYKNKIQTVKHTFVFDDNQTNYLLKLSNTSIECLEGDLKERLEKYLPDLPKKCHRYLVRNDRKVKCLCHGDYRLNNILVKEMNSEVTKILPIDYQLIYYGSPVLDVIFLIFTSTDQQFRRKYLENMKNIYFESLTKFLKYFNIEAETVYPQKEYENDFKDQLEYGLLISLFFLPFVLAAEDDVPEVNLDAKKIKTDDEFKPRLEGIIDDFIEWGYL